MSRLTCGPVIHCRLLEVGILPCDLDVNSTNTQLKLLSCANIITFIADYNLHYFFLEETLKGKKDLDQSDAPSAGSPDRSNHRRQVNHDAADQEE